MNQLNNTNTSKKKLEQKKDVLSSSVIPGTDNSCKNAEDNNSTTLSESKIDEKSTASKHNDSEADRNDTNLNLNDKKHVKRNVGDDFVYTEFFKIFIF